MEKFNYEEMETPTLCEHCGATFDLNDGRRSNKWHLDITICEQCGIAEMQEIEEDDIVEVTNHDLGEVLCDFKERGWGKVSDENKALIIQLINKGKADSVCPNIECENGIVRFAYGIPICCKICSEKTDY